MNADFHRVENLDLKEIRKLEKNGGYFREIIVESNGKKDEITLFSLEKENLEFKEE